MATEYFSVKTDGMDKLESDLGRLSKVGLPIAIRSTLNDTAFAARPIAQGVIRKKFVTRNKFTERRVIFQNGPRTLNIKQMRSSVGHTEGFMEDQEFGGRTKKRGKYQTVIPTHEASGEVKSSSPRKRAVISGRRLRKIALDSRKVTAPRHQGGRFKSKKQEFMVTGMAALKTGKRYFLLHSNSARYKAIIYRINKSRTKKGVKYPTETKAVYYFRTDRTLIRKKRWLEETVNTSTKLMAGFYEDRVREQLVRNNIPMKVKT